MGKFPRWTCAGTYVHGLFTRCVSSCVAANFGVASLLAYDARIEAALDALAIILRRTSISIEFSQSPQPLDSRGQNE